jgi:hypothetical protein
VAFRRLTLALTKYESQNLAQNMMELMQFPNGSQGFNMMGQMEQMDFGLGGVKPKAT